MSEQMRPFISASCEGERCFCATPAVRKVGEEILHDDPSPNRHNLTAYVCAKHYAELMGPEGARSVGQAILAPVMTDHAELARLAEAASEGHWDTSYDADHYEWDLVCHRPDLAVSGDTEALGSIETPANAAFIAAANPARVLALLAEIAALRGENEILMTGGIIEVAVRNPSVADYVKHWEGRALQAERQRDELRKALERIAYTPDGEDGLSLNECVDLARQALANQGAEDMTPATEALVERLSQAEQVQRWAHNDPMVSLLVEAQVEIRRLSADHVSDARQMVSPPPAGEE